MSDRHSDSGVLLSDDPDDTIDEPTIFDRNCQFFDETGRDTLTDHVLDGIADEPTTIDHEPWHMFDTIRPFGTRLRAVWPWGLALLISLPLLYFMFQYCG